MAIRGWGAYMGEQNFESLGGVGVLGLASLCGKERLVDSTQRLNTPPLPLNIPVPSELGATWSLTRQVKWRFLQSRCIVLAPLRPPGYHGILLLPERKRDTWSSQLFTKKLTQWNWPLLIPPSARAPAFTFQPLVIWHGAQNRSKLKECFRNEIEAPITALTVEFPPSGGNSIAKHPGKSGLTHPHWSPLSTDQQTGRQEGEVQRK